MPVSSKEDLPGPLQRVAYSALKHSFKKVGDHWEQGR